MASAPSEDSDQPGHTPSPIRVFAVRMKKAWVLSYPGRMPRLIWVLARRTCHFVDFVMRRLKCRFLLCTRVWGELACDDENKMIDVISIATSLCCNIRLFATNMFFSSYKYRLDWTFKLKRCTPPTKKQNRISSFRLFQKFMCICTALNEIARHCLRWNKRCNNCNFRSMKSEIMLAEMFDYSASQTDFDILHRLLWHLFHNSEINRQWKLCRYKFFTCKIANGLYPYTVFCAHRHHFPVSARERLTCITYWK